MIHSPLNYSLSTLISLTPLEVQIGPPIFCSQTFSIYSHVLLPYKRLVKITVLCKLLLNSVSINVQQHATIYSLLYFCKLLYMFRVVTSPIIRSTYNCNYSIWHRSNRLCYLPLSWSCWNRSSAVTPPIIRSTYNCNYSIWHRSNRLCYLRYRGAVGTAVLQ